MEERETRKHKEQCFCYVWICIWPCGRNSAGSQHAQSQVKFIKLESGGASEKRNTDAPGVHTSPRTFSQAVLSPTTPLYLFQLLRDSSFDSFPTMTHKLIRCTSKLAQKEHCRDMRMACGFPQTNLHLLHSLWRSLWSHVLLRLRDSLILACARLSREGVILTRLVISSSWGSQKVVTLT